MTATETEAIEDFTSNITERMERMEGEVAELRHTVSELAEIVVGDIRERREAAIAVSAPVSEIPIPASLVPGGESTLNTVRALRKPWLLFEFLREVGITIRMYMDPRYRVRRSTQLMVPAIMGLLVANYFFFNLLFLYIPVITEIIERTIDIVLAILIYKIIIREVARYRQMISQLAYSPRAWNTVPAALINNDPDGAALRRTDNP